MNAKNKYLFPVPKEKVTKILAGEGPGRPAHINGKNFDPPFGDDRQAIDFYCPNGTEIYATQDGVVVWVESKFKKGGKNPKFAFNVNGIGIKHKNKEFTNYLHLKYKGVLVKVGDKVKRSLIYHVFIKLLLENFEGKR
jgi:murein DD-endopeptidase MepM/ murein hydrolase activator NlpD